MELHPSEIENLRANMSGDKRIHIHHRDGFAGLSSICPPEPKRGIALIDPSYELAEDYTKAANALIDAHHRWPVGTLVLWYPIVERRRSELLAVKDRLQVSGIPEILTAELTVDESNEEGFGLAGSGLLMIQPPWGLAEMLADGAALASDDSRQKTKREPQKSNGLRKLDTPARTFYSGRHTISSGRGAIPHRR